MDIENNFIHNKKYFITEINSSKANKFTALYHYSGTGFTKAILNLGIFRISDNKLIGVMQWGCSYQEKINLKRYVKNKINKDEYLELNRFAMADEEGHNAESLGISLGIKWIKKNKPEIKLLVSYSGRKEGNYGYIYQATNWIYLGYFLSNGFWKVDGEERHVVTLWYRHQRYGNMNLPLKDDLCNMYSDVRQYISKQFIYIQLLDDKLILASNKLDYPKITNEHPIVIKEIVYKRDEDKNNSYIIPRKYVEYYYEEDKLLFSKRTLIKRKERKARAEGKEEEIKKPLHRGQYGQYDKYGHLEKTSTSIKDLCVNTEFNEQGILKSLKNTTFYKDKIFFRFPIDDIVPDEIDVPWYCIIDEIPFYSVADAQKYLGVTRQCVSVAHTRKQKKIIGKDVIWFDNL